MAFDLVFFGGTGDLVWRKLMPALFQAFRHDTLPEGGRIIGVGRDAMSDEQYRQQIQSRFEQVEGDKRPKPEEFARFAAMLCYVRMDLSQPASYAALAERLAERETDSVVMYLSTAPSLFTTVCEQLAANGLNTAKTRIVLEKPLGQDLACAPGVRGAAARARHGRQPRVGRAHRAQGPLAAARCVQLARRASAR